MILSRYNDRSTPRERELVKVILDSLEELSRIVFYAKKLNVEVFLNENHADSIGFHRDIE